ncbi:MAG: hypothetical protein ACFE85_08165 [Candidatus Hodarchaeota archaeon]
MSILILSLMVSVILLIFYILLTIKYKNYLENVYERKKYEEKVKHIEKFIPVEKKDLMSEKLEKISSIIVETERHIDKVVKEKLKVTQEQLEARTEESEIIEMGGREYRTFIAGMRSAFPKTEEQLLRDIENLKDTMQILEILEDSSKVVDSKKKDVGAGIFYEKMSRRFQEIINNYNLNEYRFIPIQRLKFHAFNEIKNIKNSDFLPILNLMKETNLLYDIVELNPKFHILVFEEEEYEFSNPEKVVLTFGYDIEDLTIRKLLEVTEWDYTYADKILNNMKDNDILSILDESIIIQGFGYKEERKKWNAKIDEQIEKEKLIEEEKLKRRLALKAKLKEKLEEIGKQKLEEIREVLSQKEEYKDQEIEEVESTPKIKFESKPKVKRLPSTNGAIKIKLEDLSDLELDHIEVEEPKLKELIPPKVLSFHEKFSLLNGGFAQYEKIKSYIEEDIENVPDDLLKDILKQLKELKFIYSATRIRKYKYYLFKEMKLNQNERKFIGFVVNKTPMEKEELMKGLKWGEGRTLTTMKKLQEKGILRIKSNKVIIPGIIQKE